MIAGRTNARPAAGADRWFSIKSKIHAKLLNSLSPEQLKALNKEGVREQIGNVVERLITEESIPMTLSTPMQDCRPTTKRGFTSLSVASVWAGFAISTMLCSVASSAAVKPRGKVA